MAVADFNGDGVPDFALAQNTGQVSVYLNQGNETFSPPITTTISTDPTKTIGSLFAGDFDEDGKQDLIAMMLNGSSEVLLGNGAGTFALQSTIAVGPGRIGNGVVVDINGDSHLDFIAGNDRTIDVAFGDGRGSFTVTYLGYPLTPMFSAALGVLAVDLNSDSKKDLVFGVAVGSDLNLVRYFPNNGNNTFASSGSVLGTQIQKPASLSSADFNGDGKADLLIAGSPKVGVILGDGSGSFQPTGANVHFLTLPQPKTVLCSAYAVPADVNKDSKPDIVVLDTCSSTIDVYVNDGTGAFSQSSPDFTGQASLFYEALLTADFNGDGLPDPIMISPENGGLVSIFYSVKPVPTLAISSSNPTSLTGSSLTITAKVGDGGSPVPTGAVTLSEGSNSLGQQTLDGSGTAKFSLSNLAVGQHTLTAAYAGDSNFQSASSPSLTQSVGDFQIALPSASQSVVAGGAAAYSLTVTPAGGLTGSISITCSQLPSLASCDPVSVPVNGQPATATLTVHTTAPITSRSNSTIQAASLGLIAIACTALFPLRKRRPIQLLAVMVGLALAGSATGCSGGSTKSTTTTPGTPQGTTQFTITSSVTLGGQTLTRTSTAMLVVQ
ncbi:MAG TPA: FG-GAP-like repeat-containing protein [Edaphobacter sp.]|nr:FG-GAP-like repeat-containing protein [Edaphobacter sp.]